MSTHLTDKPKEPLMPDKWIDRAKEIRQNQNFKEIYSTYLSRHFSFIVTASLTYTSVTPNQVTVSMIVFGLIGFGFLSIGSPYGFLLGGIFFALLNIADAVDGELARYKKITTIGGDYLDRVAHYFTNSLSILGVGIGLFQQYNQLWILLFACLVEVVYTFDEIARDLLVTCGLQSIDSDSSNRKELKSVSKIQLPKKAKIMLQLTATNLAFFHLLIIFSMLDLITITYLKLLPSEVYFVACYALFFL